MWALKVSAQQVLHFLLIFKRALMIEMIGLVTEEHFYAIFCKFYPLGFDKYVGQLAIFQNYAHLIVSLQQTKAPTPTMSSHYWTLKIEDTLTLRSFCQTHVILITFIQDFIMSLSVLLLGSVDDKLEWIFNLYDLNGDRILTSDELEDILASVFLLTNYLKLHNLSKGV